MSVSVSMSVSVPVSVPVPVPVAVPVSVLVSVPVSVPVPVPVSVPMPSQTAQVSRISPQTSRISRLSLSLTLCSSLMTLAHLGCDEEPNSSIEMGGMSALGSSGGESGDTGESVGGSRGGDAGNSVGNRAGERDQGFNQDLDEGSAGRFPSAGEGAGTASSTSGEMSGEDAGSEPPLSGEMSGALAGDQAGVTAGGESSPPEVTCDEPRASDERVIALGFPFSETLGESGRTLGLYRVNESGALRPWGARVDVGFKVKSLRFSRDGLWLIALGEDGGVATLDLRANSPILTSSAEIISGYFKAIESGRVAREFDLVNGNSAEDGGIYTLYLKCDGAVELAARYEPLRLIQGISRLRDTPQDVIIFGGQALFDPIDPIDLRWMRQERADEDWRGIAELDVFADALDAINIGSSPDDRWLLLVNGSPFTEEGGQVRFIEILRDPPELVERQSFEGYRDARGAWFTPDGRIALVTQFEPGRVQVFTRDENAQDLSERWRPDINLTGFGLASALAITPTLSMATTSEEELSWWAFVPTTSPAGGSFVSPIYINYDGAVMSLPTSRLGDSASDIAGPIAAWPEIKQ